MFPPQLIWFLAPTVPLCEQQYRTICTHIPQVQCRLLVGSDNVERWTSQAIWNSVLLNIKIVVSPHKILVDALGFGFVDMERLALLVFDEGNFSLNLRQPLEFVWSTIFEKQLLIVYYFAQHIIAMVITLRMK